MRLDPEEVQPEPVIVNDHPDVLGDGLAVGEEGDDENSETSHEVHEKRFFKEPLYCQRYQFVMDLLKQDRWKRHLRRLVDVGANDCSFLFRLRNSSGMRYLREVIALDLDEDELTYGRERTVSLMSASLFRDQKRPFYPCDVYHMAGNVADKDQRLKDIDAVVAIEIIEHLKPSELERFPETVFGHMKPKLAVITTPNSEFNILFPHFVGPFRHWDHKFEFTRQEFQDWATSITELYPEYSVEFDGVGFAPHDDSRQNLGPCTQIAIFLRKDFEESANNGDFAHREEASHLDCRTGGSLVSSFPEPNSEPYKIVVHNHHPRQVDVRSMEERVFDSVYDEILRLNEMMGRNGEEREDEVPEKPKIYISDLTDVIESRCYDDYGDPYQLQEEKVREIVVVIGRGVHSGEDEKGIYFTVDDEYFASQENQSEDEQQFEADDLWELLQGPAMHLGGIEPEEFEEWA